jgi:hypothetical protein
VDIGVEYLPASKPHKGFNSFFACGIPAIFFFDLSMVWATFSVNCIHLHKFTGFEGRGSLVVKTYLFEHIRKTILLRGRLSRSCLALGLALDSSIWIQSSDDTVGFLEDLAPLFNQRSHGIDELLFIELVFGLSLRRINSLCRF